MDLQTELLNATTFNATTFNSGKIDVERIIGSYYDIDEKQNYKQYWKEFVSDYFQVQSSSLEVIKDYYYANFGIEYEDEEELKRRLYKKCKPGMFHIIDPYHQYDSVNSKKQLINDWKYRNDDFMIVSNNKKLFYSVVKKLEYESGGTMAKIGMLKYVEERVFGQWYCLDIRKNLDIKINKHSDGIVSFNSGNNTVYYSFIHKLWGFEWENFKVIYKLLIGHEYDHQEIIIKRLINTIDGDNYAVIDSSSKLLLKVDREKSQEYKFRSEEFRIVSDGKLLFENYLNVIPIYRRGYRKTLS